MGYYDAAKIGNIFCITKGCFLFSSCCYFIPPEEIVLQTAGSKMKNGQATARPVSKL